MQGKYLFAALSLLIAPIIYFAPGVSAASNLTIYGDSISQGWENWSWGSGINFDNPSPVVSGSKSIFFDPGAWAALYLHTDNIIDLSSYKSFSLNLFATSSNQRFAVIFYDTNNQPIGSPKNLMDFGGIPNVNGWKKYSIPVSAIGGNIKGFAVQEISGQDQGHVFIDQIELESPEIASRNSGTEDVFLDNLVSGWQDWSWGSTVNFSSEISFIPQPWGSLYLHSDAGINTADFPYLLFNLKSSQNNQRLQIGFYDEANLQTSNFKPLANYGGETSTDWRIYSIPLAEFNASQKQIKGVAIQDATGQNQQTIFIDNIKFTKQSGDQNTQPTASPIPTPSLASKDLQPLIHAGYTASSNRIFNNGSNIKLKGISWFGFETGTHVVHGLWSRNWKEVITQIKSLGFNSVRVPFCPATLKGVSPTSIDYAKNSDLTGLNSLQVLDKVLTEMNNQGIYILLDHHTPDCNSISQFWHANGYSENDWINDLKFIAERYKNLPYFMGIDIKNEPHGGATWGTGNANTDWNLAAEKAGREVLNVNPNLLIFVQGIQENSTCSSNIAHWMGGNLEPFNCNPISTSFIPSNKLVLSPHIYGPDVYFQGYFNDGNFPNNMTDIWEKHFGYLVNKGLTIVPGEWGGKYGNGGQAKDKIWQDAFVSYMKSKNICSSYYWSFNPNSGDTGGILKDDWISVWENKLNLLHDYFNTCN